MKAHKELPARLSSLRNQRGMTQTKLAAQAEINRAQYNRYEKGETTPSIETLSKIAEALGISIDYLAEGKEENAAIANFKDRDLLEMFKQVENFSEKKKEVVKGLLSEMIENQKHQEAVGARLATSAP